MTTIAAACDGDLVWMAADTATCVQGNTARGAAVKVYELKVSGQQKRALIGVTGSGALARFQPELPEITESGLDDWASRCADQFTDWAFERQLTEDGQIDGKLLLGFQGRLWVLLKYQTVPIQETVAAIGSGADFALGALHQWSLETPRDAQRAVREAVEVACYYDPNCEEPITVLGV
jgi:ATP-dependent protease HslVU (ClpYQ) peptidase subunit